LTIYLNFDIVNTESEEINMDNIKEKIKTLSDETISNMLNQRKNHTSSFKELLIAEQEKRKKPKQLEFNFS